MPLSKEELAEIAKSVLEGITTPINDIVHKAVTVRLDRVERSFNDILDAKLAESAKASDAKFDEYMASVLANDEREHGGGGGGDGRGSVDIPDEFKARLTEAEKKAEAASAKAAKWEEDARRARLESMRQEEQTALTQKLTGKVKGPLLAMTVSQLHAAHLVRDKRDEKVMLWKKPSKDGGAEEYLSLDAGVQEFLDSDVGKELRPPANAMGTGSRGAEGGPTMQAAQGGMTLELLGGLLSGNR